VADAFDRSEVSVQRERRAAGQQGVDARAGQQHDDIDRVVRLLHE
jgi:hypothetical protein